MVRNSELRMVGARFSYATRARSYIRAHQYTKHRTSCQQPEMSGNVLYMQLYKSRLSNRFGAASCSFTKVRLSRIGTSCRAHSSQLHSATLCIGFVDVTIMISSMQRLRVPHPPSSAVFVCKPLYVTRPDLLVSPKIGFVSSAQNTLVGIMYGRRQYSVLFQSGLFRNGNTMLYASVALP